MQIELRKFAQACGSLLTTNPAAPLFAGFSYISLASLLLNVPYATSFQYF